MLYIVTLGLVGLSVTVAAIVIAHSAMRWLDARRRIKAELRRIARGLPY